MRIELQRLARRQGGVFTRQQALRLGVSSRDITQRLLDGSWLELLPSVLIAATTPITPQAQAWAGVLAIGPPVSLAGRFGAAWVGLERAPAFTEPEFAIPVNRMWRDIDGLTVHRVRGHLWEVRRWRGLPVPPTELIIRQLAAGAHEHIVLEVAQHALRRRQVTIDQLVRQLGRGRPGAARLRQVLEQVAPGYQAMWEQRLHRALLKLGVRLTPQVEVRAPDGRRAFLDLGDEEIKFGVEVDGFLNHMARFASDRRRARLLAVECDWTIAPYAVEELAADLDAAAQEVAAYVRRLRRERGLAVA
jgi:hypothetical protein